jgi:hypothetical protein
LMHIDPQREHQVKKCVNTSWQQQNKTTNINNQQPSNQINNHNSICAGLMEGRFPDSLLNELRSALQNQCVFGLCRFLSA